MPRKWHLSAFENGKIVAHEANLWPVLLVAEELERSTNAVSVSLQDQVV